MAGKWRESLSRKTKTVKVNVNLKVGSSYRILRPMAVNRGWNWKDRRRRSLESEATVSDEQGGWTHTGKYLELTHEDRSRWECRALKEEGVRHCELKTLWTRRDEDKWRGVRGKLRVCTDEELENERGSLRELLRP